MAGLTRFNRLESRESQRRSAPLGRVPAALVVLAMIAGAGAEDDVPVRGRGDGAEDGPKVRVVEPPAGEAAETPGPFVLGLANGDRITGTLVGLDDGRLRFRPDATKDVELPVPLGKIEGLERSRPDERVEPRGDRVYPVAGGVIHGTLTGIVGGRLMIDAHLVAPIELDVQSVAAFVRGDLEQPERSAADTLYEIHDAAGSRLVGQAAFQPTGVKISSPGLTAEIALREVAVILFPVVERMGPTTTCTLELMNGDEIVGTAPRLEAGRLVLGIGGTGKAAVPIEHVAGVKFGGAAAGGRRQVLLWTKCADEDEEAAHLAEALEKGLPRDWQVVTDADAGDAETLAAGLKTAGVLVVAEMESFDKDALPDPGELGGVLRAFLARGGVVVLTGMDKLEYWNETGLFTIASVKRADDKTPFTFVPGNPVAKGVGESFTAVNGTHEYATKDDSLRPVATRQGGGAAVLVKRAGRGAIVLLGMDFYQRSPEADRLLINAVTQPR